MQAKCCIKHNFKAKYSPQKKYTILLIHHFGFFFSITWKQQREVNKWLGTLYRQQNCCNPQCGFPQFSENKVKHFHVIWKSWWQRLLLYSCTLTLLLRHTTGHMDMPRVQQQQMQPQSNQRILTGIVLLRTLLTRVTVALNSSGAT